MAAPQDEEKLAEMDDFSQVVRVQRFQVGAHKVRPPYALDDVCERNRGGPVAGLAAALESRPASAKYRIDTYTLNEQTGASMQRSRLAT